MANELSIDFGFRYSKNSNQIHIPTTNFSIDVGSTLYLGVTQEIGTLYEALYNTGLASGGAAYFFNNDPTNFVEIGLEVSAAFQPLIRIPPQKFAFLPRLSTTALFARANTAAVNLSYLIFQP
jgi:hypothetical protein